MVDNEDLRIQLNRGQEQVGFAQPLGGSYTKKNKYAYKVRVQEVSPEEVSEVRTIRSIAPMDVSDDEVHPVEKVGDWLDEYKGKWESD